VVAVGRRDARRGEHLVDGRPDDREHRPVVGRVGDGDVGPEAHPVEIGGQRLRGAGLHVEPHGVVDVGEHGVVLDAALDVEHQGLGARAVGQVGDLLGQQQVQPAQPLGAGDADDTAVGAVDDAGATGERALLAERVAVVGGHRGVAGLGRVVLVGRGLGRDRARFGEGGRGS
jgi:hypothetical protein